MKIVKNVPKYVAGAGALATLGDLLAEHRAAKGAHALILVDEFFRNGGLVASLPVTDGDQVLYVETKDEPTTEYVDELHAAVRAHAPGLPAVVVGIGGGITLDSAKAVANLLTNGGKAEDYQGWDLVREPAIYKIGIPTLSGTGAEASRTCVMTNQRKNLKLGMNSDHTIYDLLVLDHDLTRTVARDQYFYTGMDTYIHCVESLAGSYRNAIADAFSQKAIDLCRDVFLAPDMMADGPREQLMVASYLGGSAIASTFVGVVHPLSAALSVVLHTHHCVSNCIVMQHMQDFYPEATAEFLEMAKRQGVSIPQGVYAGLREEDFDRLYASAIVHEKPLTNALGPNFKDVLTKERAIELFKKM